MTAACGGDGCVRPAAVGGVRACVAMSLETRSSSALFKRAEQLRQWEESATNREPVNGAHRSRKIKFSSGCVFLAACAAGEKEEVLLLLEKGADIDTANVDGLTALHQVKQLIRAHTSVLRM